MSLLATSWPRCTRRSSCGRADRPSRPRNRSVGYEVEAVARAGHLTEFAQPSNGIGLLDQLRGWVVLQHQPGQRRVQQEHPIVATVGDQDRGQLLADRV